MLKTLIITGHLFGIFLLSFLFSDEITITDTFPESLKVGENYAVTTSVVKNDVSGFAKYQIDAPRGVVIKPIDLNGASFTFKDGKAKFIWMNLPSTTSFDIRYEVTLEDGEIGTDKIVNSRLSYLVENERKIHQGPNHLLKVIGDDETASSTNITTSSEISATRKITAEGENKFLVEIEVNKLGVKGFAKIQDMIPDGFVASEVMNSEAIFTQINNKVKLVWFDIPKNISLKVSYQIEALEDFQGDAEIAGKFHYMAGSDLKKIDVPTKTITMDGAVADISTSNESGTTASKDDSSIEANPNTRSDNDLATSDIDKTSASDVPEKSIWDTDYNADKNKEIADEAKAEVEKSTERAKSDIESSTALSDNTISKSSDSKSISETGSPEILADNSNKNIGDNVTRDNSDNVQVTAEDNNPSTHENSMDDIVDGNNPTAQNNDFADSNNTPNRTKAGSMDDLMNGDKPSFTLSDVETNNNMSSSSNEDVNVTSNTANQIESENNSADASNKSEGVNSYSNDEKEMSTELVADKMDKSMSEANQTTINSSSEYANINDMTGSIDDKAAEIKASVDMTTAVAEPESTAVAKKEYAKDEVLADVNTFNSVSNLSDVDKGINYRVQILAGKNVVGKEYLRKKHSYYSQFTIENHEGWVKYTSGSFGTYQNARDQRNVIRDQYNFDGPFVSAYNDGVRITVQEALMISKQQWYN